MTGTARLVMLVIGVLLVGYALWALYTGRVLSTWGRIEYRPGTIYWITVLALLLMGGANLALLIRSLLK